MMCRLLNLKSFVKALIKYNHSTHVLESHVWGRNVGWHVSAISLAKPKFKIESRVSSFLNQGSKSEEIFRIEIDSRSSKPKIFRIEIDSSSSKTKIFRIEIDSSSSRYRISWLEADSSSRKSKISRLQSNKMRFNRKETLAKKSANDIEVSHGIKMI